MRLQSPRLNRERDRERGIERDRERDREREKERERERERERKRTLTDKGGRGGIIDGVCTHGRPIPFARTHTRTHARATRTCGVPGGKV